MIIDKTMAVDQIKTAQSKQLKQSKKYNKQSQMNQTKNDKVLNKIEKVDEQSFKNDTVFFWAVKSCNHDKLNEMIVAEKIHPMDLYDIRELPENIKKELKLRNSKTDWNNRALTPIHILALLNSTKAVKSAITRAYQSFSLINNQKNQSNQKKETNQHIDLINSIKTQQSFNLTFDYDDYIALIKNNQTNLLVQLSRIVDNFPERTRDYSKRAFYEYNEDGVLSLSHRNNHGVNLTALAIENDNLELFQFYESLGYQTNRSYIQTMKKLSMNNSEKRPKTKIYPKKIIHYLINDYLEVQRQLMDIKNKKQSKIDMQSFMGSLNPNRIMEKMMVKNRDFEAFKKLAQNNEFYNQNNGVLHKVASNFLSHGLVEEFQLLHYWTQECNIKMEKTLIVNYFEKTDFYGFFDNADERQSRTHNIMSKEKAFHYVMKNKDIKHDFIEGCQSAMPNVQSDIQKLKYLDNSGVDIDNEKTRNKITNSFNLFKRDIEAMKNNNKENVEPNKKWPQNQNIAFGDYPIFAEKQCQFVVESSTLFPKLFETMDQELKILDYFDYLKSNATKTGLKKLQPFLNHLDNFKLKYRQNNIQKQETNNNKINKKML